MARLNMSHGTYEEHAKYIELIRDAAKLEKKKFQLLLIYQDHEYKKTKDIL